MTVLTLSVLRRMRAVPPSGFRTGNYGGTEEMDSASVFDVGVGYVVRNMWKWRACVHVHLNSCGGHYLGTSVFGQLANSSPNMARYTYDQYS